MSWYAATLYVLAGVAIAGFILLEWVFVFLLH